MTTDRKTQGDDIVLARQTVRAAMDLVQELLKARTAFGQEMLPAINATIRCLERAEFAKPDHESKFEVLEEFLAMQLLQEVVGTTATLSEVFSDAGCIEYELASMPVFSATGRQLECVQRALHAFMQLRAELKVRQCAEEVLRHSTLG